MAVALPCAQFCHRLDPLSAFAAADDSFSSGVHPLQLSSLDVCSFSFTLFTFCHPASKTYQKLFICFSLSLCSSLHTIIDPHGLDPSSQASPPLLHSNIGGTLQLFLERPHISQSISPTANPLLKFHDKRFLLPLSASYPLVDQKSVR